LPTPDRSEFTFDGAPVAFTEGQSFGAALLAAGHRTLRRTRVGGNPRGMFCGIGVCADCLVTVDGAPGVRACLTRARAGVSVRTADGLELPAEMPVEPTPEVRR
jgi:predicted molibdopterin-dependent oxidoreductase YjgC